MMLAVTYTCVHNTSYVAETSACHELKQPCLGDDRSYTYINEVENPQDAC